MSEYSGCKKEDFEPLMESYKEEFKSGCGGNKGTLPNEIDKRGAKTSKLAEFLKTPKMKKLRKEAMKFQGADKVTKMVKDQAES
jgi:hypothetical protein